ncbi:pre-peptidase C-terminal domain-containing protein [Persicitalea jodogahamensis]|uniref:Peptidase C-terminal archaeal/bacterial domain-containing protein n=1 Tax=Persicitalea jodogahamensis TaxID=402147 RepID=A0A8J3D1Z1_9BACT|nr:pre-peptidase C-terminal domain-containing protein [Persicitalea jodogahamensis]GHB66978.1 hypothetical protein GCM10007390_20340 [Persicitalea jodogahamensis]
MKNGYLLLFLLFTVTTSYAQTIETEPNDSFVQANLIQDGVVMQTAISVGGDIDYFKINITKPCVINVAAENIPNALSLRLKMYNSANQQLTVDSEGYGENVYIDQLVCQPGVYYIAVYSYSGGDKSPTLFNLRATIDESDIYECNNSFTDAKPIQAGVPIQIALNDEGDIDYFKINIAKPCVLNLAAENIPNALSLRLRVYNSANQSLEVESQGYGQNVYLDQLVCQPGVYYIAVYSYSGGDKSPTLFNLRATIDESDIYECNNSFTDAKPIQAGVPIQLALNDEGDIDYFKINIAKSCVLNLAAENIPGTLSIRLKLYNSANQELSVESASYGKNVYLDKLVCEPGVYYIAVYSYSGGDKSVALFNLKVTANELDIYECNNTFADAKDIPLGHPIQAALNEGEDVDYFKFTLAFQATLNVTIPTPPTSLNPRITIYNGSQQQVGVATGSANQTVSINNLTLAPGTYYVKVSQTNNYVNELYTLYVSANCIPFTVKSGNWDDPTVWLCGQVPGGADLVVIRHAVVISGSFAAHANQIAYEAGGSLTMEANSQIQLGN